jgi:hypothetical protein
MRARSREVVDEPGVYVITSPGDIDETVHYPPA